MLRWRGHERVVGLTSAERWATGTRADVRAARRADARRGRGPTRGATESGAVQAAPPITSTKRLLGRNGRKSPWLTGPRSATPREHDLERFEQDAEIEPERHVLEVIEVVADLLHLLLEPVRVPVANLCPPGDPRP